MSDDFHQSSCINAKLFRTAVFQSSAQKERERERERAKRERDGIAVPVAHCAEGDAAVNL